MDGPFWIYAIIGEIKNNTWLDSVYPVLKKDYIHRFAGFFPKVFPRFPDEASLDLFWIELESFSGNTG